MDRADPRSGDDALVGQTVDGRWHVLRRIGVGAVGAVYLAERAKLGRQVALKLLHPEYLSNNEFVSRFAREARALSRLQHINCVSILDVGTAPARAICSRPVFQLGLARDTHASAGTCTRSPRATIARTV